MTPGRGARFGLLGPLEVRDEAGALVDVGGRQPRLVLAALLLAGSRPLAADALMDAIWGEDQPASAGVTLRSYVSRLRRRLEEAGGGTRLDYDEAGYRLVLDDPEALDLQRFDVLVAEGRARAAAGDHEGARAVLAEAEGLWRGPALVDLLDTDAGAAAAARYEELRLAAVEDRVASELALGRHVAVVGELAALVLAAPLREGLWAALALALYRSGRQAEALRSLADAGRRLRDEFGLEPSRPLRDLESAILAQDPALDLPAVPAAPVPASPSRPVSAGSPARAAGGVAAVVGRDRELAELRAALAEAAVDARFVVIEGEPGIGKTHLADALRAEAEAAGSLAVWGRSDESGAAPALWPWLAPLRAAAERAESGAPAVEELLAGAVPLLAAQGAAVQFERFDAVGALLESVGTTAPAVILLDDLQWADPTSLQLLGFLAGRLRRGVLLVATVRTLDLSPSDELTAALAALARRAGHRRLQLQGLSAASTADVLTAGGRVLTPRAVEQIHARAEGNPFYALELARLAEDEDEDGLPAEVPATVGDVIRRRLARLPEATVALLGVAAIGGRDVDLGLVAACADLRLDEVVDGLDPAVVQRLLVEVPDRPGVLRFAHALVREVLVDGLTPLRRARLHLKVADAMEAGGAGRDDAEVLADHLWRASGVGVAPRAAAALERAAEVAVARVAYAAAESLLLRAVQLRRATGASDEDRRAELAAVSRLLQVTQATRFFQGADRDVLARARSLADQLGDEDAGRTFFWFDWAALATATKVAEAAAPALEYLALTAAHPDPEVRSGGHTIAGTACWQQGRVAEAVAHYDEASRLLVGCPPPADAFAAEMQLRTHTFTALAHGLVGDRDEEETFEVFDAMIALAPPVAVPSICGFAGTTAAARGRWDLVERYQELALEADPSWQFAFWGGQLLMYRGMVEAWRGDVEAALASFEEGRALYTGIGGRSGLATFLASLATLVAECGHAVDAARIAAEARAELETYGERWNEPVVLLADAAVAAAAGEPHLAAARLAEAEAVARAQGSLALARRAASTALQQDVVR